MDGIDDIDFDAVGSLLLDDENLASIFELALTDSVFDEQDDDEEDINISKSTTAPAANFVDAAQLEQQLLQQSQEQQQHQQSIQRAPSAPQTQSGPGGAPLPVPQFNWQPPYPTWRWGMPLPMGYPPPPIALQQHMMRLQHMQHMQHMQRMQQQQPQQQQQQQQQPSGGQGAQSQQQQRQPQNVQKNKQQKKPAKQQKTPKQDAASASSNKGSANWADGKTKSEGNDETNDKDKSAPLSLEEIMKAEQEAATSGKPITAILPSAKAPVQQQQQQRGPRGSLEVRQPKEDTRRVRGSFWHGNGPLPRVDETCMMKVHELVGIMKFQMRPLYTNDTFRDDYYFAEAEVRQQTRVLNGMPLLPLGSYEGGNEMGGAASRLGARPGINQPKRIKRKKKRVPGSGAISVPAKLSLSGRENVSRQRLVEKARKFQQESKALGLYVKGSVRTPRKLMDIGSRTTSSDSASGNAAGESKQQMLSASHWQVRLSINRCVGLLMSIKTLVDSGSRGKKSELEKTFLIKSLAAELGIKPVITEDGDDAENPEAMCDPQVLKSIADTTKGRRMLCRALPILNPVQMRALVIASMRILPSLVAVGDPKDIEAATTLQLKKEAWWKAVLDEKISDLLIRGFGTAMMPFPADGGQAVFEVMPVALSALLDAHDDEALQKLVNTRGGATAIQDFVMRGQAYCAPHPDFSAKWGELYQMFVSKVTAKK